MGFTPRPFQLHALDSLDYFLQHGGKNALITIPTGTGKTIIALEAARRLRERGMRALWIANREVLVTQPWKKAKDTWPLASKGIVQAQRNQIGAKDIIFASIQTISQQDEFDMLQRLASCGEFGFIIIDEAHHVMAPSYARVLEYLGVGQPGGPVLLGLTATPDRADGRSLATVFDRVIYEMSLRQAVTQGHLCPIRSPIEVVIKGLRLKTVPIQGGDYIEAELAKAVNNTDIAEQIADSYVEHAMGRRAVVFTVFVDQARRCFSAFKRRKVPAAWVSGNTTEEEYERVMLALAEDKIKVVCNANFLTEGWDNPVISCIINARPTRSRGMYTQIVGRGTRLCEDIVDKDLLIIDAVAEDSRDTMKAVDLFGSEIYQGLKSTGEVDHGVTFTSRVISWRKRNKNTYVAEIPGAKAMVVYNSPDDMWVIRLTVGDNTGVTGAFHNKEIAIGSATDALKDVSNII